MKVWKLNTRSISRLAQFVVAQCQPKAKLVPFVLVRVGEAFGFVTLLVKYVSLVGLLFLFHFGVRSKVGELFVLGNVKIGI